MSSAPLEIAFMIRYLAEQRKISDKTEIKVIHPEWSQAYGELRTVFRGDVQQTYGAV
jgi:hypothetical protein